MAVKRVHQIAKELGITSKELLGILHSMGEDIQNPLSSVSESTEKALAKELEKPKAEKPKKKTAAKDKAPAKAKKASKPGARKPEKKAPAVEKKPAKAAKQPSKKQAKAAVEKKIEEKAPPSTGEEKEPSGPRPAYPQKPPQAKKSPTHRQPTHEKPRGAAKKPVHPAERGRQQQRPPGKSRPDRRGQFAAERPQVPKEPGTKPMKKKLRIPAGITVKEFAQRVGKTPSRIISILMGLGEMITIDQAISDDAIMLVAEELGVDLEIKSRGLDETISYEDAPESLQPRPPVVTVMGHVDHGKTSLLDAIRNTAVIDEEMGGITQHIGASVVEYDDKTITFVDTPGHESFTLMRARGAQVTDIAVLVIAADDGVMPQTIEAIDHAKAAEVPIMVAVNKIDKAEADPTRIRQQLTEFNLLAEEWGGDTVFVDVSAKERTNLDHLLEMILLVAEIHDFRANPDAPASGNVIEARLDKGRGPVATLLVKRGTLKKGDTLMAGKTSGRVRALIDDKGRMIQEAGPSTPVEILGFDAVPEAGDEFVVVEDDKKARSMAEAKITKERAIEDRKAVRSLSLEDLFRQIQEGEVQEFNLIIKGDTQGSVEAVRDSVEKIKVGEIVINIIHTGVGAVTENDVMLAKASNAVIIGFNVRPDSNAHEIAAKEKVDVRTYRVIYQLLEELEAALVGMLKPEYEEVKVGEVEVRAVFKVPRQGAIAGSYVKEGEINRNSKVRLLRDGSIVYEGAVSSLRRFKDDVRSVSAGYECGVGLENFQDVKEGDIIEVVEMREIPRSVEAADS
jgi:translation initiation factor IF-2